MALAKPTAAELRTLVKSSLTDPELGTIIDDAALMAEDCPSIAGYSEAKQKAIVRYVAAHLLQVGAGGGSGVKTSKALGDASESYAAPVLGMGLAGSTFGQQAIALDPSGCLADLGKRKTRMWSV